MRTLIISILFISFLYSDFKLSYLIDSNINQTAYYKDEHHVIFKIKDNSKKLEDLLLIGSKKYVKFQENGIEHIYEISDKSTHTSNTQSNINNNYIITKIEKNIRYKGFNAQKWTIKHNNNKIENIIVTDNKELFDNVSKTLKALKEILPKNKINSTSIFIIKKKFVILKTSNLSLIDYKKEFIKDSYFNINKTLNKNEQLKLSKGITNCFINVCCGNKNEDNSKELYKFLNKDANNWKLKNIAKCNNKTQKNLESAIYIKNNKYITVELSTNKDLTEGKIISLKKQGIKIVDIKNLNIYGYSAQSAYLPIINATILDITLPNTTISLYTKGKMDLSNFSKKALILYKSPSYTLTD